MPAKKKADKPLEYRCQINVGGAQATVIETYEEIEQLRQKAEEQGESRVEVHFIGNEKACRIMIDADAISAVQELPPPPPVQEMRAEVSE